MGAGEDDLLGSWLPFLALEKRSDIQDKIPFSLLALT